MSKLYWKCSWDLISKQNDELAKVVITKIETVNVQRKHTKENKQTIKKNNNNKTNDKVNTINTILHFEGTTSIKAGLFI